MIMIRTAKRHEVLMAQNMLREHGLIMAENRMSNHIDMQDMYCLVATTLTLLKVYIHIHICISSFIIDEQDVFTVVS